MPRKPQKPGNLFLVHCRLGFPKDGTDYEHAGKQKETMRIFKSAGAASWFIKALKKWPKLHEFLGVYASRQEWKTITEDQLPSGTMVPTDDEEEVDGI